MDDYTLSILSQMRHVGATLKQIAEHFGISRERVRQLLVQRCGSTRVSHLLGTDELARQADCSYARIQKLTLRGIIKPAKIIGKNRRLWKPETVDILVQYLANLHCPVCSRPLPNNRSVYCSASCYAKAYHHRYLKMSWEQRRKHTERVRLWQETHPEKAREIARRKARAYSSRQSAKRYESHRYTIRGKCLIPLGSIVKIVGWEPTGRRLMVEWDDGIIEVPAACVKRLADQTL